MKSTSQANQDMFAIKTASNKTYIEIGAFKPIKFSNSYNLEMQGWNGFSLEFNKANKKDWDLCTERSNTVYWEDAMAFDYASAAITHNLGTRVGYISVDIEPPENTFKALKQVIEQGIIADCITFEHDKYQAGTDIEPDVIEYLLSKGYKVAVKDVYVLRKSRIEGIKKKIEEKCFFETWFVYHDIDIKEQTYDEWLKDLV